MTNQEQATSEDVQPKAKRNYVADHARRTLRAAGLSKKDAKRVVEEIAKTEGLTFDLSTFSRKLPCHVGEVLFQGFIWADTPEGFGYWEALTRELDKKKENVDA